MTVKPTAPVRSQRVGRLTALSTAIAVAALTAPSASADTTHAFCSLSPHDHTAVIVSGPCIVSQMQGNADVSFKGESYRFLAKDEGKTYSRSQEEVGLRFQREGSYTLTVLWNPPGSKRGTQCVMNPQLYGYNWKPCRVAPISGSKDGFTVRFEGKHDAPWFSFKPVAGQTSTTHGRLMVDANGSRWRLVGHHSFVMTEVDGFRNRLEVSSW